ncbi:MAG: trypsin-like peptidase domain-containing protein [Pirellulales bacterium]|nr:trypsin-like peptidase domain-containing protein [Pirellulales bacterium]
MFADDSLSPWQHGLPQATSRDERTDKLIAYLVGKYRADTHENAMVLLLGALIRHIDPADALYGRLTTLSNELALELRDKSQPHSPTEGPRTSMLRDFASGLREQVAHGNVQFALDRLRNYIGVLDPALCSQIQADVDRYCRLRRDSEKGELSSRKVESEEQLLLETLLALLPPRLVQASAEYCPVVPPNFVVREKYLSSPLPFERILGVNNLKQIAWIQHGLQASKSVCRILTPEGLATGFMIGRGLLMTNNHVLPNASLAIESLAEFNYQSDFDGNVQGTCRYKLDTARFHTSTALDYTIVGVSEAAEKPPLASWGCLFVNANADPVRGEHVVIVQHPNGGLKQIVVTANQVTGCWQHRLYYTTDTMPGSSGSPVFNDLWEVIALHRAGGHLPVNSTGTTQFINEGVLMSTIRPDACDYWPELSDRLAP